MQPRPSLASLVAARTLLALFVAYVALNLGRALKTNYDTTRHIRALKTGIAALEQQQAFLGNELVYYRSRSYQELEAKRRLGLRRPGETVVLVPANADPERSAASPDLVPVTPQPPAEQLPFFDAASKNAATWLDWLRTPADD